MIRQMAFWPHIPGYNTIRELAKKPRKRSEKRQRTERITIRLLPSERATLAAAAQLVNVSEAELVRWTALHYVHMYGETHLITYRNIWTKRSTHESR